MKEKTVLLLAGILIGIATGLLPLIAFVLGYTRHSFKAVWVFLLALGVLTTGVILLLASALLAVLVFAVPIVVVAFLWSYFISWLEYQLGKMAA